MSKILVVNTETGEVYETTLTISEIKIAEQAKNEMNELENELSSMDKRINELKHATFTRVNEVKKAFARANNFSEKEIDEIDENFAKAFAFVSTECGKTFDELAHDILYDEDAFNAFKLSLRVFKL